jgi:hypothetical protein
MVPQPGQLTPKLVATKAKRHHPPGLRLDGLEIAQFPCTEPDLFILPEIVPFQINGTLLEIARMDLNEKRLEFLLVQVGNSEKVPKYGPKTTVVIPVFEGQEPKTDILTVADACKSRPQVTRLQKGIIFY